MRTVPDPTILSRNMYYYCNIMHSKPHPPSSLRPHPRPPWALRWCDALAMKGAVGNRAHPLPSQVYRRWSSCETQLAFDCSIHSIDSTSHGNTITSDILRDISLHDINRYRSQVILRVILITTFLLQSLLLSRWTTATTTDTSTTTATTPTSVNIKTELLLLPRPQHYYFYTT